MSKTFIPKCPKHLFKNVPKITPIFGLFAGKALNGLNHCPKCPKHLFQNVQNIYSKMSKLSKTFIQKCPKCPKHLFKNVPKITPIFGLFAGKALNGLNHCPKCPKHLFKNVQIVQNIYSKMSKMSKTFIFKNVPKITPIFGLFAGNLTHC
jgi:hypothetical protein